MPRNINKGFEDFHSKIKTSAVETIAAKSHRTSIERCLKSNFGLNRFTRIGSFGNGTNISGYSDVDYLACLPRIELTNTSTASLTKVRNALNIRFSSTNVKVSAPAVVCPFGTRKSEDTEIVVANYIKEKNGFKVYEISDCNDGWMEVSPDAHNDYVAKVDKKHSGKVKPLIRFIKAWKYYANVPISSFYLEMKVAKYASNELSIVYDIDVQRILNILMSDELSRIQDPTGVSGYISPCKTEAFKRDALSKLSTATIRANKARIAESNGDTETAFYWWNLLYNYNFPKY
ncbi:TPA: SMODS domain-containing nucleotidyltransferase [Photobacterium damselae]